MPKDVDADAVEIGALYRVAMGDVTDSRYFSEKISQNRNGTPEHAVWRSVARLIVVRVGAGIAALPTPAIGAASHL